jgi:hypothetical protein
MDDIKAASLLQRVTSVGILTDKERLERGQNDSNIKPMIQINIAGVPFGDTFGGTQNNPKDNV